MDGPGGRPKARWTPRARLLAASIFILVAVAGFSAALLGAICAEPSLDCLRNEGRDAVRLAVISAPFIAYGAYRITHGRAGPR